MKKECQRCKQEKFLAEYNKHKSMPDGLQKICKECRREIYYNDREHNVEKSKKWYQKNKEYKLDYDKEYYKKNKIVIDEKKREYRKKNPDKYLEMLHRNRAKNPEGDRARHILNYHVEKGEIAKACICETNGCNRTDLHGHHDDYSQPLNVRWVCPKHHHDLHRNELKG